MNPDKFAKRMRAISATFEKNTDDMMVAVALTMHSAVVLGTPVDTGRARGSWFVEIDKTAEGMLSKDDKTEFGYVPSRTKAEAKLAQYKGQASIHLTNNLPYITPLNEGHSKQAPEGFVEIAIEAAIKQVRKTRLLDENTIKFG